MMLKPETAAVARYQLLTHLATGGMAEIWLARMSGLERFAKLVALKRILPALSQDDYYVAMFLDEARLAAQFGHPNIVEVYDIGCAAGLYFFTMEYVHGTDLRRVLGASVARFGRVPLAEALIVAIGVASGLHHAHERTGDDGRPLGVIHRDVSPSNILVRHDGIVKLIDFGVAKAASHQSITQVGYVKGKCAYMSPEQVRGQAIDRRSDLFALGVVLWEMTVGRRLFRGDDEATIERVRRGEVPLPSAIVPGYPRELESIVMRALAPDRTGRFASAQELQLALETFAHARGLALSPVSLARFMSNLFPALPPGAVRATAAEADGGDTVVEGQPPANSSAISLVIDLATPTPEPDTTETAPPPPRPRRMPVLSLLLLLLAVAVAMVSMALVAMTARHVDGPARTGAARGR